MDERREVAPGTGARPGVDEFDPRRGESVEFGLDVVAAIGDVMEGGAAALDETPDAGIGMEGFEQFDVPAERNPDTLAFQGLRVGTTFAGEEFEKAARVLQRGDRDRHVIQGHSPWKGIIHERPALMRLGGGLYAGGIVDPAARHDKEMAVATSSAIIEVTDDNFATEVEANDGLSMVDFWATWCGPCRMVAPIVGQLADEYRDKGLKVAKLDVDANPGTSARFGVRSIPTILFFKGGKLVDQVIGFVPRPHLEEKIQKHI